jgi:hypothetical protein
VTDPDATCQQRAAYVIYMLVLRALAGMDGLATGHVTDLCCILRAGFGHDIMGSAVKRAWEVIRAMRHIHVLLALSFLSLATAGCRTTTPEVLLPFQEIEVSSFIRESYDQQPEPDFFIIASRDEIVPPGSGLSFLPGTLERIEQVDFSRSFVAVFLVGQIPGNGTVDEVVRSGDTVTIQLGPYSVGPGNYVLEEYTAAYRYVAITKQGTWNRDVLFLLRAKVGDRDWLRQTSHYIP